MVASDLTQMTLVPRAILSTQFKTMLKLNNASINKVGRFYSNKFKTLLESIRSKVDKLDMLYVNIITLVSNRFLLERLTQDFFIGTWGAKMLHMDQHGVSEKNSNLTK